jgi:hypothetical protein
VSELEPEVIEPGLEAYEDPLDQLPAEIRDAAKAYRTIALLYMLTRNADRFGAWLRATAQTLEQLIAEAERDGGAG